VPHLSAYLDSVGSNFSHGANFATAGSTIRPQNTTQSQSGYSPISLNVQSVQYSDFKKRSQIVRSQGDQSHPIFLVVTINVIIIIFFWWMLDELIWKRRLEIWNYPMRFCWIITGGIFETLMPKADYFSKALYTIDIGQNDLTAGYKLNLTTEQVKANVPDMLGQFSNAVKVKQGFSSTYTYIHINQFMFIHTFWSDHVCAANLCRRRKIILDT